MNVEWIHYAEREFVRFAFASETSCFFDRDYLSSRFKFVKVEHEKLIEELAYWSCVQRLRHIMFFNNLLIRLKKGICLNHAVNFGLWISTT